MHKATNLAENKIVYDIEAPQNNSIIGDITCTVKYQKQIIENASDNKRSVLIVENEYQLYNNSELLLSLLNDNGSVEIIINSTEVEDSTDEDNNLEIGGANKSDNIGVAVDKKKNEKYFYFDMDSITINEIISAVVSGAKSVSERETPINGKSVVKLKVVYVKKYSILDNLLQQMKKLNYTKENLEAQVDELLKDIYSQIQDFNSKYGKFINRENYIGFIAEEDVKGLKPIIIDLHKYIDKYVDNYASKVNKKNLQQAAWSYVKFHLAIISAAFTGGATAPYIYISLGEFFVDLYTLIHQSTYVKKEEYHLYSLMNSRYFLLLAMQFGYKLHILSEYSSGIKGCYLYQENGEYRKLTFLDKAKVIEKSLNQWYYSFEFNTYFQSGNKLDILKTILGDSYDKLFDKTMLLQKIDTRYGEIYESRHKELYDNYISNLSHLLFIETPSYTSSYLSAIIDSKLHTVENNSVNKDINILIFTNSLKETAVSFVGKDLKHNLSIQNTHTTVKEDSMRDEIIYSVKKIAPFMSSAPSEYHKMRKYGLEDYAEYDRVISDNNNKIANIMFLSCFHYASKKTMINDICTGLEKILETIKLSSHDFIHYFNKKDLSEDIDDIKNTELDDINIETLHEAFLIVEDIYDSINDIYDTKELQKINEQISSVVHRLSYFFAVWQSKNRVPIDKVVEKIEENIDSIFRTGIISFEPFKFIKLYSYFMHYSSLNDFYINELDEYNYMYANNTTYSLVLPTIHKLYTNVFLYIFGIDRLSSYEYEYKKSNFFQKEYYQVHEKLRTIFKNKLLLKVNNTVMEIYNSLLLSMININPYTISYYRINKSYVYDMKNELFYICFKALEVKYRNYSNQNMHHEAGNYLYYYNELYQIAKFIYDNILSNNKLISELLKPVDENVVANIDSYIENMKLLFSDYIRVLGDYINIDKIHNNDIGEEQDSFKMDTSFIRIFYKEFYKETSQEIYRDTVISFFLMNQYVFDETFINSSFKSMQQGKIFKKNKISLESLVKTILEFHDVVSGSIKKEYFHKPNLFDISNQASIVRKYRYVFDIQDFFKGILKLTYTKLMDGIYPTADIKENENINKLMYTLYIDSGMLPPHTTINQYCICTPYELTDNISIFDKTHILLANQNMDINFLYDSKSFLAGIHDAEKASEIFRNKIFTYVTGHNIEGLENPLLNKYKEMYYKDKLAKDNDESVGAYAAWLYIQKKYQEYNKSEQKDKILDIDINTIKAKLCLKDELEHTDDNLHKNSNMHNNNINARRKTKTVDSPATTLAKSFYHVVAYTNEYKLINELVPKKQINVEQDNNQQQLRNNTFVESMYEIARQNLRSAYMQEEKRKFQDTTNEKDKKIVVNQQPFIGIVTLWVLPKGILGG